ncbi:MAG: hypothetical protein WD473_02340, partial [Acidimicrobiia bacterium]
GWEPHPGAWPLTEIAFALSRGLRDFAEALDTKYPDLAALFGDRPSNLYDSLRTHPPGFWPTAISDHPEIGDLTRALQRHIGLSLDE